MFLTKASEIVVGQRFAEVISLKLVTSVGFEKDRLFVGFQPFGNNLEIERAAQRDHRVADPRAVLAISGSAGSTSGRKSWFFSCAEIWTIARTCDTDVLIGNAVSASGAAASPPSETSLKSVVRDWMRAPACKTSAKKWTCSGELSFYNIDKSA